MRRLPVYALLLLAALGVSCGDDDPEQIPIGPSPVEITEAFAGPLTVNGAVTHTFPVERLGDITATLMTLTADPALDPVPVVSLALGTWNGVACGIVVANDQTPPVAGGTPAAINSVIGRNSVAGTFCLRVSDPGTLTRAVNYEVQVTHF